MGKVGDHAEEVMMTYRVEDNTIDASQELCARCGQKSKIGGLRLITHRLPMELVCFSCWFKQLYGIEKDKQAKVT